MQISVDKWDKRLLRADLTMLIIIIVTSILYYQIIPYGDHETIIHISMIVGSITAIGPQIALHRLMSKRKKNNVKRGKLVGQH